jgi:hypothetical protein
MSAFAHSHGPRNIDPSTLIRHPGGLAPVEAATTVDGETATQGELAYQTG